MYRAALPCINTINNLFDNTYDAVILNAIDSFVINVNVCCNCHSRDAPIDVWSIWFTLFDNIFNYVDENVDVNAIGDVFINIECYCCC